MLSRDVCKTCIDRFSIPNEYSGDVWVLAHWDGWKEKRDGYCWEHDKTVHCPSCFSKPKCGAEWTVWTLDSGVPEWCPYATEHLVSQDAE